MYLGEVTRNVILSLVDAVPPLLFNGLSTPTLNTQYGFDTAYMSEIETAPTVSDVVKILTERLGFEEGAVSEQDAKIVRWCVEHAATRAARLSACAVAAVLVQTEGALLGGGKKGEAKPARAGQAFKVGVDGSLIQHYPEFESRLRKALKAIVGEEAERLVEIGMAKDGSGVGGEYLSMFERRNLICCVVAVSCSMCFAGAETGTKRGCRKR